MANERFHGASYDEILSIARKGKIEASKFSEEKIFQSLELQEDIYETEEGVWMIDSEDHVQTYSRGGGYLVIDTSNLELIENNNSHYSIVPGDIGLEHVNKMFLEENTQSARDYMWELATELTESGYGDIELKEYRELPFEID